MSNQDSSASRRARPKTGYPRRRAVAACSNCRERKRKCDNVRPICSACQQIGASCDYAKQDASTFDPASLEIIERLSEIERLVRRIQPSSTLTSLLAGYGGQTQPLPQPPSFSSAGDNAWAASGAPQDQTFPLDARSIISANRLLQWPAFDELLSALPRFEFTDFHGSQAHTHLDDLFFRSDTSLPPLPSGQGGPNSSLPSISTEKADIEQLVDEFFRKVNNKNPILSRREAAVHCEAYYEHGARFDLSTCLVLLTCALGAVSMDFNHSDSDEDLDNSVASPVRSARLRLGHSYFVAAQKRLGAAVSNVDTLSIQCLCLAGVYYMYTLKPICALRMFNSAGSLLQISLSTSMGAVKCESNIYSNLFSMCYKSESKEILEEIPISMPALRESSFPASYPPPPQAEGLGFSPWSSHEEDSWYFFLSEIALRRITSQVAEVVSKYCDGGNPGFSSENIEELVSIVMELEHQVETFREQLPPAIQFPDVPQAADSEWMQYTRGRYYRVLELMHRPFLFSAVHVTECSHVVRGLAEKCLANALKYLQHSRICHRHHGTWLQLRNMLKEACLLLVASMDSRLSMPAEWEDGVSKAVCAFDYWSIEFPPCGTYSNIIHTLAEQSKTRRRFDRCGMSFASS